jgi:hypothetical protein
MKRKEGPSEKDDLINLLNLTRIMSMLQKKWMHNSPKMANESFEGKSNWKYFQCWIVYVEQQAPKASTSSQNDSTLHDKFKLQTRNFLYWIYNFSSKHMHLNGKALALFFPLVFSSRSLAINLCCLNFSDLSETYLTLTYISIGSSEIWRTQYTSLLNFKRFNFMIKKIRKKYRCFMQGRSYYGGPFEFLTFLQTIAFKDLKFRKPP